MHGWDLKQVPEVPLPPTHTHTQACCQLNPKSGIAGHGLQELSGKCGCGGGGGPSEGATVIRGGELLIAPCENNVAHTSSTVWRRTQYGWGWKIL